MLPRTLAFNTKQNAAKASSIRVNVMPQGGSGPYRLGETIQIAIPPTRGRFLCPNESFLKLSVSVTNTDGNAATFRWDTAGAHGLFSSLRVSHGSNTLEHTQQYGALVAMLNNLQQSAASRGRENILTGTGDTDFYAFLPAVADGAAAALERNVPLRSINQGSLLASGVLAGATSTPVTYCLPLVSILGTLSNQYFPLYACSSGPVMLELQVVDSLWRAMGIVGVTGSDGVQNSTVQITGVEYVATYVDVLDESIAVIEKAQPGPRLEMVVPAWTRYAGNIASVIANGQYNIPISAQFSSLRSIFISMHDRAGKTYFPHSSVNFNLASYQFSIGGVPVPSKAPSSYPEMFAECLKAIGTLSDLSNTPAIDYSSYTQNSTTAMSNVAGSTSFTTNSGSFYVGIDLERFGASDLTSLYAGTDTSQDQITWIPTFSGTAVDTARPLALNAFCLHDAIISFEAGVAYARW